MLTGGLFTGDQQERRTRNVLPGGRLDFRTMASSEIGLGLRRVGLPVGVPESTQRPLAGASDGGTDLLHLTEGT